MINLTSWLESLSRMRDTGQTESKRHETFGVEVETIELDPKEADKEKEFPKNE
jgi:hypothetical protein